jgi:hypothetical protein
MLYEVNFVLDLTYIGYLLIGFGIGYLVTLGVRSGPDNTKLDRMKDDLAAKKEWYRMLAEGRRQKGNHNVTL